MNPLQVEPDTSDLRTGPPLHDDLLALLPLLGEWTGSGSGFVPESGEQFHYVQHLRFAHDGRPFLAYQSRTWLVDGSGEIIRPASRESGFWRPGAGPDDIEATIALATGLTLVFTGQVGELRWELATRTVGRTPTAKAVDGDRRLYGLVDDELAYAQELAPGGKPFAPHLSARLHRISPV